MKKKVLIIIENATFPFDPRVHKEATTLAQNGYEVTVLCPRHPACGKRYEFIQGVHVYRHPMLNEGNSTPGYMFEYLRALFWEFLYAWWIYLRRGFHVIQGCNPPDTIFIIALPYKLFGVKYIFDHHDAVPELYLAKYTEKGIFYKLQLWLERLTFRFSDVVMSTNCTYREIAMTRGGVDPKDVFIVRNGPDLRTFKPVPPNVELKYGKPYLIGYVGKMSVQEGLDILLDVALRLKTLGRRDIHFTCVGGGPALAGLRKMVKDRKLEDTVNFTGRIPDDQLLQIVSTADVCVNPDRPCEMNDISTMIKIMEYMALGKPIVQFDSREGRFSAMEASLYADAADPVADFASKILWLIDHPEDRNRMGQFGRKRVEEELAWDYSVPNLLAAYEKVFFKRGQRCCTSRITDPSRLDFSRATGARSPGWREKAKSRQVKPLLNKALIDQYRCPEAIAEYCLSGELSEDSGYFAFGPGTICHGQSASGYRSTRPKQPLYDAAWDVKTVGSNLGLPFDAAKVVDNLRYERYVSDDVRQTGRPLTRRALRKAYYTLRPLLPVPVRSHFQRVFLRGWRRKPFPNWPVDVSVEKILERILVLSMKAKGLDEVPFIWFWPEGAQSCVLMTHDVETTLGRDFCATLMDIDDEFGVKASFQIVPQKRYAVFESFLGSLRQRGFEVLVQDLNHDGYLFWEWNEFLRRAKLINQYGREYGARGFRAAVMYRNQDWYSALDFSYDMSIPNVAHLDPQPGGCCTVFPYFIGDILELPVTTTQDYTLFHILKHSDITHWKTQIRLILERHGLISFIVHPDYIIARRPQQLYRDLLAHLRRLRAEENVWITLPGEVDSWWRARSQMTLVSQAGTWHIEGPQKERARIAYAQVENGQITYRLGTESQGRIPVVG